VGNLLDALESIKHLAMTERAAFFQEKELRQNNF